MRWIMFCFVAMVMGASAMWCIEDGLGLGTFLKINLHPLFLGIYLVIYLAFRFTVFKDAYKYGLEVSQKKKDEIYRSISNNVIKDLRPDLCQVGYYVDLNANHVSPSGLLANFDDRMLYYYHEPWVSFAETPKENLRLAIPFSDILDFELIRGGETVFTSSAVSSAATGYAIGGMVGAAIFSSASRTNDIREHERNKRMNLKINIITTSPISPLVELPLTKEGPFSNASNEEIDKAVDEILAILHQIIASKPAKVEEQMPIAIEEQSSMRRRKHSADSKISKIKELKELLDSGAITQAEYDTLKDEIMKEEQ